MILLLLAAQVAAATVVGDQKRAAMEQSRAAWMQCTDQAANEWALTFRDLAPSEIATAAIGNCLGNEMTFREAAVRYASGGEDAATDRTIGELRDRQHEHLMAAILAIREHQPVRSLRTK